jgi:nucleoside-diphosphate-sugar epimerase
MRDDLNKPCFQLGLRQGNTNAGAFVARRAYRLQIVLALALPCFFPAPLQAAAETVVVAGATGRTGNSIVNELARTGFDVIALARDINKITEKRPNVKWQAANVRDYDTLQRAMMGADYVVSAIGSVTSTGPNSPELVDFAGTRNLVDAAKNAGVKHFVLIGSGRSGPQTDHSTRAVNGYTRYFKTKGEVYLIGSGVPFTILGAAGLMPKPAGQMGVRFFSRIEYAATTKSTDETAVIAIDDIAEIVSAALRDPAARNKAFAVMNDPKEPPGAWRTTFSQTDPTWP